MTTLPAEGANGPKHRMQSVDPDLTSGASATPEVRVSYDADEVARDAEILDLKMALISTRDHQARAVRAHVAQLASYEKRKAEDANVALERESSRLEATRQVADLTVRLQTTEQRMARAQTQLAQRDRELSRILVARDQLAEDLAVARRNLEMANRTLRVMDQIEHIAGGTSPIAALGSHPTGPKRTDSALRRIARAVRSRTATLDHLRSELRESPLFDAAWYLGQRPDLQAAQVDLIDHFVLYGIDEGASPNPLIDMAWIAKSSAQGRESPLRSYLLEGRYADMSPLALFDVVYYRKLAGLDGSADALSHYLRHGRASGLSPHRLFDRSFYVSQLPSLGRWRVDPFLHYVLFPLELDPHPLFSTEYYLRQYPDLRALGISPLSHYLERGFSDRSSPHASFSGSAYLDRHRDVASAGLNPLLHYVTVGRAEGRRIDPVT